VAAASNRVSLGMDAPSDLVVYGDPALFARVFENLVRNAVQYNCEGGRVGVTARLMPREGEWVADHVSVRVLYTGDAIPPTEWLRIFDRFYRLDPSRSRRTGGTGLGLAISREIVHLFNGTIRVVDSTAGETTIEVQLPGGRMST
jgi:signal transduction histidine kinase